MAGRDLRGHLNHTEAQQVPQVITEPEEKLPVCPSQTKVWTSAELISTHKFLTTCLRISNQVLMLKLLTESGSKLYMARHLKLSRTEAPTNQLAKASMDQNEANWVRWRQRSQEENQCEYVHNDANPTLLQKPQIQEIAVHRGLQQKSRLYTIHRVLKGF